MSPSSRTSAEAAGWRNSRIGDYKQLLPQHVSRISWLDPRVLWRSRNDVLASLFGDPTSDDRHRWVSRQLEQGVSADFAIERNDPDHYSFMYLADTGEGGEAQYAVVPGFLKMSQDARFSLLSSDVIYPTGSTNEYGDKFFRPYQNFDAPIYAVPGNHDWYDGLQGFMRVFCKVPDLPPRNRAKLFSKARLRDALWKSPDPVDEELLVEVSKLRSRPGQVDEQPGPYWMMDAGPIRIVGIDTGMHGGIDKEQGEWLRRISLGGRPKVLITGKPIYVDNGYQPCPIEGGGTVDEIIRDPDCNYVAAIGGDIHNYQRYPVKVGDRTIQYVVCGGGGAFMSATHTIPRVGVGGVDESEFRCYPLRGDSLAFYSRVYGKRLKLRWLFDLSEDQAAAAVFRRLGVTPVRGAPGKASLRARIVAAALGVPRGLHSRSGFLRLPVHQLYQRLFSPTSTYYDPPFFKNFLRVDVTPGGMRIRCFGATGFQQAETDPPLEDDFLVNFP